MRYATRIALAAFAFVLWAGPAAAQNDVTFQVDLSKYIPTCQFTPDTQTVFVRGSFQKTDSAPDGFTLANPLTAAGNGIYTTTASIPEGPITFKFYVADNSDTTMPSELLGWESTNDRPYTVTAGAQTIPTIVFAGPDVSDQCGATDIDYDLVFQVDMSIQQSFGKFDPATQNVAVTGGFTDWNGTNAVPLALESSGNGIYTGISQNTLTVPQGGGLASSFKFIIRNNSDNSTIATWESTDPAVTADLIGTDLNRAIRVTGNESDSDGNGRLDFVYDNDANPNTAPFFSDQTADAFLADPATVTFNVDMRPAQYLIADAGSLPAVTGSDPSTGNTAINGVFINGPAAGQANEDAAGINDWAGWGTELAAQRSRQLTDPDGDNIYSLTLTYPAGTARTIVAKFGVNGADDEALGSTNHNFAISSGQNTFDVKYGCMNRLDGTYVDDEGAMEATDMMPAVNAPYDEYLLINNSLTPPTCTVVRNGGLNDTGAVAVENGPTISGLAISAAYPNPVRGAGRIDVTLDRAMSVSARVFDVMGREVATLLDGRQVAAGKTTVDFATTGLASGVYVLRVEADGQVATRRLTVTR